MKPKYSHDKSRWQELDEIFSKPHWGQGFDIDQVETQISNREISLQSIKRLDMILEAVSAHPRQDRHVNFLEKLTADWTKSSLRQTRKAFWVLLEHSPFLRDLDLVIANRDSTKGHKIRPPMIRIFSVNLEELPESWQAALRDMEDKFPGMDGSLPVPSMITTTRTKLCELAKAAQMVQLPVTLKKEALIAYEQSLLNRERPLSPKTILSSLRQVRGFARYIGAEDEILAHLKERIRFHERRAHNAPAQKEHKILQLPDYSEIFGIALDRLGQAAQTSNPKSAQALRNTAVALTLFCPFPLRVADTQMRFGQEILWTNEGYRFNLIISKSKRHFTAPILPVFSFFIDQLILQGSHPCHLDDLRKRCFDDKRLLFVNYDDREPYPGYVSQLWHKELGTGSHAARTKLHDAFGQLGARGVDLAMRACDQRSEKTAEAYRTRVFEKLALEKAHADMAGTITDAEWNEFFKTA